MDATETDLELIVYPRAEHGISRSQISDSALKVLYRLRAGGYRACLVGGGVRDLLLGREPKDFDIATDAHPDEVRALFRNCRLVGRRFRLAHVQFGREIIEVATFRGRPRPGDDGVELEDGLIISDNQYGDIEEDAGRRDFTINALYYDIADFSVLDYVGGMEDLEDGLIRLIGDPEERYREDPVRMLRAVRFAAKLGLRLHPDTEAPIHRLAGLLDSIPPARLFDEVLKLFLSGHAVASFELMRLYGLFGHLFPATDRVLSTERQHYPRTLLVRALTNTDSRIDEDKPVTPAFLFAALLWEPFRDRVERLLASGMAEFEAIDRAADGVLDEQLQRTALPKRYSLPMREIWALQWRLPQTAGKRPARLLSHPRFRAAYDFLVLRAEAGEELGELVAWWTEFQIHGEAAPLPEAEAAAASESGEPARRRRRRGGRRKRGGGA